jgi:glycosyltransferase involved in cell wall biosynthesis
MATRNGTRVSVVIPCFRCERTLGDAVASVVRQTSPPAEIILVDDGSPPETTNAIRALVSQHGESIRPVFLPSNRGPGAARNAGWARATQPYVAFLDADDTWHPEKISVQHDFMERHPEIALCGHLLDVSMRRRAGVATSIPADYAVTEISARSFLVRNAFSTPTVMVRRDVPFRFDEARRHAEDVFLWQQIAFAKLRVARLELTLAHVHKPLYGAAGLSAELWKMEAAELRNLAALFGKGHIGAILLVGSSALSLFKFALRLVRVHARRLMSLRNA